MYQCFGRRQNGFQDTTHFYLSFFSLIIHILFKNQIIKDPLQNCVKQNKSIFVSSYYHSNYMSKEISLSINCTQSCTNKHPTGRDHTFIELRRFKNKLTEFLSIDDEHWFPAFEVLNQLDELINSVRKLKSELDDKIIEKRLQYALSFQTDSKILNTFKLANSDNFQKLTCQDVALIMKKIDKSRNPKASQIKNLISNLLKDQKLKLIEKISESFAHFKDSQETELLSKFRSGQSKEQQNYLNQKNERRDRHFKRVDQPYERQQRKNALPTVKIDQIQLTEGHFNIVLKVLKVRKEFVLGENKRKIEFEGGDQTGQAIAVVDSLKMVRAGAVIKINNAKVYSFHGVKQIQQNIKNSFLQQIDRDLRVNDKFNFSKPKPPREAKESREHRQGRNQRQLRGAIEQSEVPMRRIRPDRTQRIERLEREQMQNASYIRRQQQPKAKRNRDQYQNIEIYKQPIRRQISKKQEQSGQYSDDEAEESEEQQINKKLDEREKIEVQSNNKTLTKFKDIQPQMDTISVIAEIVSLNKFPENLKPRGAQNNVFAVLGDETGTIWAELPENNSFIRQNSVIFLKHVEVHVHEKYSRLILRVGENTELQKTMMRLPKINLQNDMSQQVWEQQNQEQQEQKPILVSQDF